MGSNLARRAWLPLPPTGHLGLGPGLWASPWWGSLLGTSPRAPPFLTWLRLTGKGAVRSRGAVCQQQGQRGFPVWATWPCCLGIPCSPAQGTGSLLFPASQGRKGADFSQSVPLEASSSPCPSSKVNQQGHRGGLQRQHWPLAKRHPHQPWHVPPPWCGWQWGPVTELGSA